MKKFTKSIFLLSIVVTLMTSCGEEEVIDPVFTAKSEICNQIIGAEGLYWDLENGVIRTDLPGGVPPQVDNIGGTFSHTDWPLLGFNYPAGWTPEQISGQGTIGVNVYRNDNKGIWRSLAYSAASNATPRQIRDFEVNGVLDFFNLGNNFETVCDLTQTTSPVSGINITYDNIMLRSGSMTAVVISSLTYGSSILQPQANVKVAVAPTSEFSAEVFDTFLAIEWQLLFGNPDTLYDGDSDNDGTPDVYDNYPNDPTRN